MSLDRIFAQLSVSNVAASEKWYSRLFGRPADARPMDGLVEWHHRDAAGLQLFENNEHAGKGSMTVIVDELERECKRLTEMGIQTPEIQQAETSRLLQLEDPDGNHVVLAQPA